MAIPPPVVRRAVITTAIGLAVLAGVTACDTAGSVPATAPSTTATTTTTPPPPSTTASTGPTTTSTTPPTTVDRVAEIEAIFTDLERRRLEALYTGDKEAFRALFANEGYLERSLGAFDVVEFIAPPADVHLDVLEVLADTEMCIAAVIRRDQREIFGEEALFETTRVIEIQDEDSWGLSYGGEGWICDGPHPFS